MNANPNQESTDTDTLALSSAAPEENSAEAQRLRRIERTIAALRPNLQRDNGDIELIEVDGCNIYVDMKGACVGCQLASLTLLGVQKRISDDLEEKVRVFPASVHARKQRAVA